MNDAPHRGKTGIALGFAAGRGSRPGHGSVEGLHGPGDLSHGLIRRTVTLGRVVGWRVTFVKLIRANNARLARVARVVYRHHMLGLWF